MEPNSVFCNAEIYDVRLCCLTDKLTKKMIKLLIIRNTCSSY